MGGYSGDVPSWADRSSDLSAGAQAAVVSKDRQRYVCCFEAGDEALMQRQS